MLKQTQWRDQNLIPESVVKVTDFTFRLKYNLFEVRVSQAELMARAPFNDFDVCVCVCVHAHVCVTGGYELACFLVFYFIYLTYLSHFLVLLLIQLSLSPVAKRGNNTWIY